jgi:trypsin
LLLILFNISVISYSQNASIIGGDPISIGSVPFQVSIEKDEIHNCGGVILNPEWVLTAAHCVLEDEEYIIHAGATDQTNNDIGQRIIVDQKHIHSYNEMTKVNDIALLHLSKPLCFDENIKAIDLPTETTIIKKGDIVFISGYGVSNSGTGVLRGAFSEIISNNQAEILFSNANQENLALCPTVDLTSSMLALYKQGTQASNGDSGGPAIKFNADGTTVVLIGITNFGCNAVSTPNLLPSIYADVQEHLPFILPFVEQYNSTTDFVISNSTTTINQKFIPENIIVTSSGVLNITSELYFREGKGIYIQAGGKVILSNNAKLDKCPYASGTWKGIEIQNNGELEVMHGIILNASKAVLAKPESTLNCDSLFIEGQNNYTNTGIEIDQNVNITKINNITIDKVRQGVYFKGINSLSSLLKGKISNSLYPITCIESPVIIDDYQLSNTSYGIRLINSEGSIVKGSTIGSSELGIMSFWSPMVQISNNTIGWPTQRSKNGIITSFSDKSKIYENNTIEATVTGITSWQNKIEVSNNMIDVYGSNNQFRGAIQLNNNVGSEVYENYIYASQSAFGIETQGSSSSQIHDNQVDQFSSISTRTAAIRAMGSVNENIYLNDVIGVANTTGILAQNSSFNTFDCNRTENTFEGLGIYSSSDEQEIKGNKFDSWTDLWIRSRVGIQRHQGNQFFGGKVVSELAGQPLLFSQFFVNNSSTTTLPNLMPTDITAAAEWFVNEPINETTVKTYSCNGDPGPIWMPFGGDQSKICAYWNYLKSIKTSNPELFFIKLYHLVKYSKKFPNFILPNCIKLDPVFINVCAVQKLSNIAVSLEKIGKINVNDAVLKGLQSQYLNESNPNNRENLKSQLQNELNTLRPMIKSIRQADSVRLDSIKTELNTINCIDVLVTKWKEIYKMYVNFLQKGEVNQNDRAALLSYSTDCSDLYGDAIHLARAMANTFDVTYFDQYDICLQQSEPRSRENKLSNITIYPNPSNGVVYINASKEFIGKVAVYNASGIKLKEEMVDSKEGIRSIHVADQPGIYFITIIANNGESSSHKVFLIK